jgi:hypothetical protein
MNEKKSQRTSRIHTDFWFVDPTLVIAGHLPNVLSVLNLSVGSHCFHLFQHPETSYINIFE